MAKSNNAYIKKQKEFQRKKKQQDKQARKEERKKNATGGELENMLAYVDEFGNITSTPPQKKTEQL
ncbi:MAG: hypothetical protein JSS93_01295 [Bacteroidetes bacterium]|nr:hypothetical protein [Bacteroidota bacterium]